jgi:hypothetical protein
MSRPQRTADTPVQLSVLFVPILLTPGCVIWAAGLAIAAPSVLVGSRRAAQALGLGELAVGLADNQVESPLRARHVVQVPTIEEQARGGAPGERRDQAFAAGLELILQGIAATLPARPSGQ